MLPAWVARPDSCHGASRDCLTVAVLVGWGGFGRGCAEDVGDLSAVGPCPKLQLLMPLPSGEETKRHPGGVVEPQPMMASAGSC